MELFLQTGDIVQFIPQLLEYIQTEIDNEMKQMKDEDSLYIGCKNFYAYILTDDIPSFECIEKGYDVTVTVDIDIDVYQKSWDQGIMNLSAIVEWFLTTFSGDIVLLSDTSELMVLRQRGKLVKKIIGC